MTDLLLGFALAHKDYVLGLASGYALAHVSDAAGYAFHLAMRVPWVRAAIVKNPQKAQAAIDAIANELKKDVADEAAAAQSPQKPAA